MLNALSGPVGTAVVPGGLQVVPVDRGFMAWVGHIDDNRPFRSLHGVASRLSRATARIASWKRVALSLTYLYIVGLRYQLGRENEPAGSVQRERVVRDVVERCARDEHPGDG